MDKATKWAFTAYEAQWNLFQAMPPIVAEWGWQEEVCPETQRHHYQGYLRTTRQVRLAQLVKTLPGVHFEISRDWNKLKNYCRKTETAIDGTQHSQSVVRASITMAQALIRIASKRPQCDYTRCESLEDYTRLHTYEFDTAVATILREDPDLIGLYSQPQYQRAYVKWRNVWVEKAEEQADHEPAEAGTGEASKTDRQDSPENA